MDCLSFMACVDVDAKDIPQSLLPSGQLRKKETDATGTLQGFSFIAKRSADSAGNIHGLAHLATRNWLRREGLLPGWICRANAKLAEVLGDIGYDNRVEWSGGCICRTLITPSGQGLPARTMRKGLIYYGNMEYASTLMVGIGSRSATRASDGDSQEEAWGRSSLDVEQHGQSGVDVPEPGPVGGSGRTTGKGT